MRPLLSKAHAPTDERTHRYATPILMRWHDDANHGKACAAGWSRNIYPTSTRSNSAKFYINNPHAEQILTEFDALAA
jgi:hypothetical protein